MYLNCKSFYSFRYGTYATAALVEAAVEHGITALALTNINSTCDLWDFVKLCREAGIRPIAGVEVRNGDKLLYVLLAANNKGLAWINEFLSYHLIRKKPFPEPSAQTTFFDDTWDGFVIYPFGTKLFDELLPNERIGVLPWEVNKLYAVDMKKHGEQFVIQQPVTFQNKQYFNLHRLLRAIDKNTLLSMLPKEVQASEKEIFASPAELLEAFRQYPLIVTTTYKLIDACRIEMDFKRDKTKRCYSATKEDDMVLLCKLANDGFVARYDKKNKVAYERLQKELKIIDELGFNAYFLINWDIVRYAQSRGFYHVGRGSGANSIVAYCLYITDVDPIELNLYFERFLNPERTSPPDFDIDFSWRDRDEVIDYIFKRYGKDHVAWLGSYGTFQHDAIIRELGKVFGLPDEEIKTLQREHAPVDQIKKQIRYYGSLMKDFPNIMSLHACGILITEEKITQYATLFMPPKGFPAVQMDMFTAEDIGINKFDILSQRGLGHIKEAKQLIRLNKGVDINVHDFKSFKQDERIKRRIREADTIGCFYIESPAMRQILKKLRCDDYPTLVAASSIIRPGVASSGMMREYLYRYHNRDSIQYLHPLFEEHLSETFGVMVFQEDVIKIAHYFANLSLGEADVLRRAMSGKYRSLNQFMLIKAQFLANCKQLGHPDELAGEVWRQMESFAGYSFNKAHSASFAVESYMSLYLKTYYPLEFLVAVANNEGGFYRRELYFIQLLKAGADLQPPCINSSDNYNTIQGRTVYVGFRYVKGLQEELIEKIVEERRTSGDYRHLQDFMERTGAGLEQLNTLISIGAFRFTKKSKKKLLWEAHALQKKNKTDLPAAPTLFRESPLQFQLPELKDHYLDDRYDEMEILGFATTNPFVMVADEAYKYVLAANLHKHLGKCITTLVYFIARKEVPTKTNKAMFFGTFLDRDLDWIDTVHFPDAARAYPLHTTGFYLITGKVTQEFGVYSVQVSSVQKVGYQPRSYQKMLG